MLRNLWTGAALAALSSGVVFAQGRDACLRTVEVPGAGFELVLATGGVPPSLENAPDAVVVQLRGGDLTVVLDGAGNSIRALRSSASPNCPPASDGQNRSPLQPVALYIVPNARQAAGEESMVDTRARAEPHWPSLAPNDSAGLP